ncbi:MAG: transposase [Chlorobiaceae bacterium]|nr:transposase [Chlorobiaceae bacterium]
MNECLNMNWFVSLDDAREVIGEWRDDYQSIRPHSGLGCFTPEEFRLREMECFQKKVVC